MAAVAGCDTTIEVYTGSAYVDLTEIKSIGFNDGKELLDITSFNLADKNRRRLAGLRDFTLELSGNLDSTGSDVAAAQKFIRTSMGTGVVFNVRVLWDGTVGVICPVKCSAFNVSSDVGAEVSLSITLEGNGAITEVP